MPQAKRSYLDHLVAELEKIAQSRGLEFFIDERETRRLSGEAYPAGRVVAGESLLRTSGMLDYEMRRGAVRVSVHVPEITALEQRFDWRPGDDEQLAALLDHWGEVLDGKTRANYEEWQKEGFHRVGSASDDEDLDDIDLLPDL